jgi:hypothetical protein
MAASDSLDAVKLREMAARFFRLAATSVDRNTAKAIWELGAELLEKSNEIAGGVDEALENMKEETKPP